MIDMDFCHTCDDMMDPDEDRAEIYDPKSPEAGSRIVHADCIPAGWEIA